MLSYEVYKVIHLVSLVIFFSYAAITLYASHKTKLIAILGGIATLLILVSGFGLMARLGISHKEGYPFWLTVKLGIYLILGIGVPVVSKRLPEIAKIFFFVCLAGFTYAAILANFKSM